MTDVRLPERWLSDRRLRLVSDQAFRLFVTALLWCVTNRTDGVFWDDDLRLMPGVDPERAGDCAAECVKRGLMTRRGDRWEVVDFAKTQSGSDELDRLERIRAGERERKQRQRLRDKESP